MKPGLALYLMQASSIEPGRPLRILVAASCRSPFVMRHAGALLARHGHDVVFAGASSPCTWRVDVIVTDDGHAGMVPLLLGPRHERPRMVMLGLSPWRAAAFPIGGCGPLAGWLAMRLLPERFLQLGVPAFESEVYRVPDNFRFIGAFRHAASDSATRGEPVLLAPEVATSGIRPVIVNAVRAADGGGSPRAPTSLATYAAALRHARIAVCGPSMVSVLLALQAGVPVLCLGRCAQAHALAARLRASGTGIGLPDTARLSAIVPALRSLATLARFRHRAGAVSIEFDEFDTQRLLLDAVQAPAPIPATHSTITAFAGNPHEDYYRHHSLAQPG